MSEMVKRVARILCAADGHKPDESWRKRQKAGLDAGALVIDRSQWWELYERRARDVIAAMREPSEVMMRVPELQDADDIAYVWHMMIDAALK